MSTFSKNITFGLILEIGDEDVLLQVGNEKLEVALPEHAREAVQKNATEGIYIVPFDSVNKRIVMENRSDAVQEFN